MLRKTRGTVPFAGNVVAIWKPWKLFVKRKVAGGLTEGGNGNDSQNTPGRRIHQAKDTWGRNSKNSISWLDAVFS